MVSPGHAGIAGTGCKGCAKCAHFKVLFLDVNPRIAAPYALALAGAGFFVYGLGQCTAAQNEELEWGPGNPAEE